MAHARIDLKDAVINGEDETVNVVYSRAPLPGKIALERFGIANAAVAVSLNAREKIVDAAYRQLQ